MSNFLECILKIMKAPNYNLCFFFFFGDGGYFSFESKFYMPYL